jgi:dienelactone hydrolase
MRPPLRLRLAATVVAALLLPACAGHRASTAVPTPAAGPAPSTSVAMAPVAVPEPAPPATVPVPAPPATVLAAPPEPAPARLATPLPIVGAVVELVDESRPVVSYGWTISDVRPLTTLIWYPAVPGRWPLVVFAHGYAVGPDPYVSLCEAWAAAGYVVAAPRFPLTDEHVAGDSLDESDIEEQPADVVFVMQALLAPDSPVAGAVDPSRIAVAGHSDGGLIALSVAADPPAGVRAVIALSTSPVGRPGENPALLVVQGDEDDINGWEYGQAIYDEAVPPRYLVYLLGAGHLPPFEEDSPWQAVIRGVTIAFLDRHVAGRPETAPSPLDDGEPGLATVEGAP